MTIAQPLLNGFKDHGIPAQIKKATQLAIGLFWGYTDVDDYTITFRVNINGNVKNYIKVHVNGLDYYDVEQYHVRAGKTKVNYTATDVDCFSIDEVVFRMCHPKGQNDTYFTDHGIKVVK